jgi:hypothetical protein
MTNATKETDFVFFQRQIDERQELQNKQKREFDALMPEHPAHQQANSDETPQAQKERASNWAIEEEKQATRHRVEWERLEHAQLHELGERIGLPDLETSADRRDLPPEHKAVRDDLRNAIQQMRDQTQKYKADYKDPSELLYEARRP